MPGATGWPAPSHAVQVATDESPLEWICAEPTRRPARSKIATSPLSPAGSAKVTRPPAAAGLGKDEKREETRPGPASTTDSGIQACTAVPSTVGKGTGPPTYSSSPDGPCHTSR